MHGNVHFQNLTVMWPKDHRHDFQESRFSTVSFWGSGFLGVRNYMGKDFQGRGFSGDRIFRGQNFQESRFSGVRIFRDQDFQRSGFERVRILRGQDQDFDSKDF